MITLNTNDGMRLSLKRSGNYFFVKDNMLLRKARHWAPDDFGEGDALGRTAMGYIVSNSTTLFEGMKICITDKSNGKIQIWRHPSFINVKNDVSRDHVAYLIIAMLERGHVEVAKIISDSLTWKLSDKFNQTIDFWLWHRGATTKSIPVSFLWHLVTLLQLLFLIPWNKFWRWCANELYESGLIKSKNIIWKLPFPTYAFFILCWQLRVSRSTILKPLVEYIASFEVEKGNLVLEMLTKKKKVTATDIFYYQSHIGLRWTSRMDNLSDTIRPRLAEPEEIEVNDLDKALAIYVFKNR